MANKMTAQQVRFCELYAGGMPAVRAYAEAFGVENLGKYKEDPRYDACCANGSRLLKKPEIREMVQRLQHDVYEGMCLNAERVANKLCEMAFAERDDEFYTPQVALKALDMLQKQLGLQKQNVNATVDNTTTIQVKITKKETDNNGQQGDCKSNQGHDKGPEPETGEDAGPTEADGQEFTSDGQSGRSNGD